MLKNRFRKIQCRYCEWSQEGMLYMQKHKQYGDDELTREMDKYVEGELEKHVLEGCKKVLISENKRAINPPRMKQCPCPNEGFDGHREECDY